MQFIFFYRLKDIYIYSDKDNKYSSRVESAVGSDADKYTYIRN